MPPESEALPPLNAWQVENLRLTAFFSTDAKIEPSTWWADLVGSPPETTVSRPKAGLHREDGIVEGRKLSLQVQPDRVDWTLTPFVEPAEAGVETMPSAGPFPDALNPFATLATSWLRVCPPVTRLAFGAVLFQPTADQRAGYLQIAKYLHWVKLDPDGSSDFFYQINRPRDSTSGIHGLRINRLSKWSVLLFQGFSVALGKQQLATVGYTLKESACRLELDINTAPEFAGELPRDTLPKIFQELVALGEDIASKGDIP